MTPHYRRLSEEEMNRIIMEKIPLEERLRAVYLPIIVMDCACYLTEDLLSVLRCLRMDVTKKPCRVLNACVDGYRKDNCQVMRSDLYNNLAKYTKEFYVSLSTDMTIYRMQYQQALLDRRITISAEVEQIVARVYVIRELVGFVLSLDRKFSKRMSDLLGKEINYTTEDNHYCTEMDNVLLQILKTLGIPLDLGTYQTEMALRVFKNKLNSLEI